MEASAAAVPPSVKRLSRTDPDHDPDQDAERGRSLRSRFSAWTPLSDKRRNLQLFEDRVSLVLRWFDLWTDRQRRHLMSSLLGRCTSSQLRCCRDLLMETVPLSRLDFTAVLPRVLSLYVMSFLNPLDLSAAAQVSWHWRFLAEQDCLWDRRCIRRGWFLPYSPGAREYGAWKNHYIACVSTLDWRPPPKAAARYRSLSQGTREVEEEEEEERRTARKLRQTIRETIQEEKRASLRSRRAWGSNAGPGGARGGRRWRQSSEPGLLLSSRCSIFGLTPARSSSVPLSPDRLPSSSLSRSQHRRGALSSFFYRPPSPPQVPVIHLPPPVLLLLVSNRIPAYELLLSGLKAGVVAVLYDHNGTGSTLLTQVQRAVSGRRAQRLGLLAPGGTQEVHLLHGCSLSEVALLAPQQRDFWQTLSGWVVPRAEGGGIDIFSPLAAAAGGVALLRALSALTGLQVQAPMGLATGSFQNVLSCWSDGSVCSSASARPPAAPALQFVSAGVLQGWCWQAEWLEDALQELRGLLEPRLKALSLQTRGRALGLFLWEQLHLEELCVSADLSRALTDGLTALCRAEAESRPVEFLSNYLQRWSDADGEPGGEGSAAQGAVGQGAVGLGAVGQGAGGQGAGGQGSDLARVCDPSLEWRGVAAAELQRSEELYLQRLSAVLKAYLEPLSTALTSGRSILSSTELQLILAPVSSILELNRAFQADLEARLQRWGADQCLGDVLLKLCSKLRVYSTYLSNYPTALSAIDRCRESKPLFRAFLKRTDRTLSTHMLSLQELLLCPAWRIQEYVTLLQVLSLHTPPEHPDHTHLASALNKLLGSRDYIQTLKRNTERDGLLEETQKMIHGCPSLGRGNRRLIMSQEAILLRSSSQQLPDSLRSYQQVSDLGLFLFNDVLVLTRWTVRNLAFTRVQRSTHTFQAAVALDRLAVRELTHTRYVSHAFVLEVPGRSWICTTEQREDMDDFLTALRDAISSTLRPDQ